MSVSWFGLEEDEAEECKECEEPPVQLSSSRQWAVEPPPSYSQSQSQSLPIKLEVPSLTRSNVKFQTFHKLILKSFFYLLSRLNLPSFRSSFTFLKKKKQVFQNFVLKFCQSRHQCLKSQEEVCIIIIYSILCRVLLYNSALKT